MSIHHDTENEQETQAQASPPVGETKVSPVKTFSQPPQRPLRPKGYRRIAITAIAVTLMLLLSLGVILISGVIPHSKDQVTPTPTKTLPPASPTASPSPLTIQLSLVRDNGSQDQPPAQWDIEYAQISGLADQAVQSAINTSLRETPESVKDQLLSDLAKDPSNTELSTVTMAVAGSSLSPQLLSVGYWGNTYYGGAAHELAYYAGLNFDLTNGKLLTNRDIVNPGRTGSEDQERNLQALREAVFQLVQSQLGSDGCTIDQDKLIGKPDAPSPLFFTDQGAKIGYPNYTFGANPCGFPPALIPYTKLDSILNPAYFPVTDTRRVIQRIQYQHHNALG